MSLYQFRDEGPIAVNESITVAAACTGCVCVCEGCRLHVRTNQLKTFTLSHKIDAVACWREEEVGLAAVGDRSGCLHVISLISWSIICSQAVESQGISCNQPVFSSLAVAVSGQDSLHLLVVTRTGCLYIAHDYPLHKSLGREEVEPMKVVQLNLTQEAPFICTLANVSKLPHIVTAGRPVPCTMAVWRVNKESQLSPLVHVATILSEEIVRAEVTPDGCYIVTHTQQGEVQVWLVEAMVVLGVWGGRGGQPCVTDFSLYCHGGQKEHHLCVLCHHQGMPQEELMVLSLPGLKQVYSTLVAANSLLAIGQPEQETVCVLQPELTGDKKCVHVTTLQYGSPQDRVAVLVREGKFEEAEMLVHEHHLDPELVVYEKATVLNQLVCAGEVGELPAFLQCLHVMKDVGPSAQLVLRSQYPSLAVVHSVLTVLCDKLAQNNSDSTPAVAFALDRLITFSLLAGQEGYSCETWSAFQRESCVQIVSHLLQTGRTQHAQLFWSRHQMVLYDELASLDMCTLVQLMPANLLTVVPWLSVTILPYLLAHRLHQMKEFLVEFRDVLCSLEVTDQANWPANALSLTEQLPPLILELCPCPGCPPDLSPLTDLQTTLTKLTSVLSIVHYPLSLTVYEQSSTEQLIYRALDQTITPASLHQLIADKLKTFSEEHQLNLDTLLSNYLKLFLARVPTHSSDFPGSPWEIKAVALAHSVACTDLRVACCVEVLQCVTVPWSKEVTELVHECLPLDRVGELQSLHDLLQLKAMLQYSYGIMDFNFSDHITGQLYIRHMLLQRKPQMLADTLRVAAMYKISESKVYMHHLYNLCCQNQIEKARDVLCLLGPKAQTNTATITLSFCLHRLRFSHSPGQSDPASHCGAAQLAVLCADVLSLSSPADWTGGYSQEQLLCVRDLAVEFSLFLSPEQLASRHYTRHLLLQSLSTLSSPLTGYFIPCNTLQLGRLLGYSEHEVSCLLVELWLQQATPTNSLPLVEKCPAHLTLSLLHTALSTSDWSCFTSSLASSLYKLAMHICTNCTTDLLSMALHVFRACSFLCNVLTLCKLERNGEEDSRAVPWPWAARITEQGLLLQVDSVRPSCLQLTSALLHPPPHSTPEHATTDACCSTLVQLLQSSGHLSLAHHTALQGHLYLGTSEPCVPILSAGLEKVLSMTRVDHSYGLALLLATPQNSALHLLHSRQASILSSYSRVIALCMLTTDYCRLVCLPQVQKTASSLMTSALWGKHLRQYQVTFSAAFKGGSEEKKKVLSQLLHLNHLPPQLLLAYCRAFNLDGPGALLTRLRVALTEFDTGYQVACEAAMTALGKHPFIPSLLNTFLTSKVCPYDYERIQFVLQQLLHKEKAEHQNKMQLLLDVLMSYVRCCPPSAEEQVWHSSHCHSMCKVDKNLPDSSVEKLPLHMLLEPRLGLRLLCQEIQHVSTVPRLSPIARLLDVPDDQFYCTALKSLVALETIHCSFQDLRPLLTCISHIPTQLALTVELAKHLSSEKDRVAALEVAFCLLQDHMHGDSLIDADSLRRQLCEARVRLVLVEAGLGRYLHLAGDEAATIITSLYTELPLQRDKPSAAVVHKVVERIAGLHNKSLLALTSQLLEEWLLPSTTFQPDLNSTLVREMAEVEETETDSYGENWTRMVYLLTDNCVVEPLAALLYRWAKADSPVLGSQARTTAVQLLLTVIPHSIMTKISGGTVAHLREQVQCAVFVAELASVQVSLTMETFQACSKQTLASNLLQSRANSPKALRLVVELCLHYRVADPSLWVQLLDALLALNMTGYLQRVLPRLVGLGAAHTVSNLSSVWQNVVLAPYQSGGAGGADCLAALHLLYMCPLLFQLDLPIIVQAMAGVGAHSHALSACMLLAPALRASTVKSVMKELPSGGVPQLLDEVTKSSSPELSLVTDVVYDYVDQTGQHECLLGTLYFSHLVQYLICHHRLVSLLEQSLARGRVSEAVQLVDMYHCQHSSSAPMGMDGLKSYLTVHGLSQYLDKLTGDRGE